ncbi:TonB-dependent receptor plug domain-containing protein [Pseudarcicella hirudinis]|uniref:TonB-dependent receptor plug domain-containing protein n=1 Tax=Pseudarcicella hirudinis TaxID=1079859 RepID=UPI0035EE1AFE
MKKNLLMSFVLMLGLVFQALAQERVITGKITSGEDGSVLPGVSISAKGTSRGVTSNIDGTYKISLPNEAKTLIFTFIGFSKQEVIIGSKSVIDVKMAVDVSELNEVVVVGYGTQTKRSLTGALSSVTAKQIADIPITSIEQSLQGRAAGVQITQNSGTPGGGIQVRVRGTNSIQGSNEPLYVVDGIILNTNNTTQISTGGQLLNPISDIPPGDIESMEVLKDAAASAIYGSRAANGVVLITTKHGKSGKTKVTLNYSTGFAQTWNRINTLTGPQYSALFNDMVFNRFGSINSQGQIVGFGDVWPTKGALTSLYRIY